MRRSFPGCAELPSATRVPSSDRRTSGVAQQVYVDNLAENLFKVDLFDVCQDSEPEADSTELFATRDHTFKVCGAGIDLTVFTDNDCGTDNEINGTVVGGCKTTWCTNVTGPFKTYQIGWCAMDQPNTTNTTRISNNSNASNATQHLPALQIDGPSGVLSLQERRS
jgi:hypothetical protein